MKDSDLSVLNEDKSYKKYKLILSSVKQNTDLVGIRKEANNSHATRSSRSLYKKRVIPSKLIESEAEDSSIRSRLVELRSLLLTSQELLATTISLTKRHLKATYGDAIKTFGSTVQQRNIVVDRFFSSGQEYLEQISTTLSILDSYIKDIDATGYKHTNIRELMKLEHANKNSI